VEASTHGPTESERADPPRPPPPDLLRAWLAGSSGPATARLFQKLLALVFLDAWISLGVQLHVLVGSRGLLPAAPWLDAARAGGAGWADLPTVLWLGAGDDALTAGVVLGVALALAALAGVRPRTCFAASTVLYLGYVVVGRTFLSFQWDNLLLECGLLAMLLPADRRAPWVHWLFRLLLFKLYFESGIAKWQSHLGDWQDGSAMTFYYETAPLPAWPGWYAHALPAWWHHLESRVTLVLELAVPFAFFGPRRARLAAAAALTAFQVVNLATANYGFFVHLALALHVFLLDDADVQWAGAKARAAWARLRRALPVAPPAPAPVAAVPAPAPVPAPVPVPAPARAPVPGPAAVPVPRWVGTAAAALFASAYLSVSLVEALASFAPSLKLPDRVESLRDVWDPFRLVNTYHLFGSITRDRIEPELQTLDAAGAWTAHDFRHKPGDPARAPDFVAPHQPRVDFQLWFYGLSFRGGMPAWVRALLDRACSAPEVIDGLFVAPLPPHPAAVRLAFWRYTFTTPDERRTTAAWWKRTLAATLPPSRCR
jgi:hypothetical protein